MTIRHIKRKRERYFETPETIQRRLDRERNKKNVRQRAKANRARKTPKD
jgi:hypothetical protein